MACCYSCCPWPGFSEGRDSPPRSADRGHEITSVPTTSNNKPFVEAEGRRDLGGRRHWVIVWVLCTSPGHFCPPSPPKPLYFKILGEAGAPWDCGPAAWHDDVRLCPQAASRCGSPRCTTFGGCPCIPSEICHPRANTGGPSHAQPLCKSPWQTVSDSLGGMLDASCPRASLQRGVCVLCGYLPRDLLTSQMWPPPQSNDPTGDILHCPSSGSDTEVDSNIPTVLLSHLTTTLQSINGCGQRQLWSQPPKSHGATWLGWPSLRGRGFGTLRLPEGVVPAWVKREGPFLAHPPTSAATLPASAANETILKPNHLHPSTLQHQKITELPNR